MYEPLQYTSEPERATVLLEAPKGPRFTRKKAVFLGLLPVVLALAGFSIFLAPPFSFPENTVFVVERGITHAAAANDLKAGGYIKSEMAYRALLRLFGGSGGLRAGDYFFPEAQNSIVIAWRTAKARYGLENVRVTIPEGFASSEIAARFDSEIFVRFDKAEFQRLASPYEGYLFPDTYFFLPNVTADVVVHAMTDNYKRRIETIADDIRAFGKPIKDVITMASIIEREASADPTERRTIAGILWKRLAEGMPLQVDATFAFVNGKRASEDLTVDDLKIDSPYNTYVNKGLPPGPISNPGLSAIKATVTPQTSQYYFYLSDENGQIHYAVTHDQHVANKRKYLQ